jgi:hypothetical protein
MIEKVGVMLMKSSLLTFLLLFATLYSSTAAAARFGAIAYSPRDMAYGYSYDVGTAQRAKNRALRQCRSRVGSGDCRVVKVFKRCGALATSRGGRRYGAGAGPNKSVAKKRAIRHCRNKGGRKCRARVAVCN